MGIKPDGNKSLFKVFDKKIPHLRVKHFSYSEDHDRYDYCYLNNITLNYAHAEVRVNVLVCQITDKKGKKNNLLYDYMTFK